MATITVPGMFLTGTHGARPAANAVGIGTLYACSTHALVYQSDGSTWSQWFDGGTATLSAGSNSTRVREVSTAGASSTLWSPYDHAHDGIGTITASSSNTLQRGTVNLRAGSNIVFGLTDSDGDGELDTVTIHGAASGGGGSSLTVADEGSPLSTAATTLDFVGAGVTATGSGATKTITIPGASSSGAAFVQTGADSDSGGGSVVVLPNTPSQSNLMVWVSCNNGSGPTALTQTNATWTMRSSVNQGGIGELDIWTGVWDGSGTIGTTVTASGGGGLQQAMVTEFSGATYSALNAASILHSDTLDAFNMTDIIQGIAAGRIVVFAVHSGGSAATSPAQLNVPWWGHPRQAAQSVSMGISNGNAIQGWYQPGGSLTYTLAVIDP